ncbi:MAG: hypothetical protein HY078_13315 [Elusimicrobia bacterium]|nr:hypothetical protein [Elusimicrobiota bacterium]
MTRLLLPLLVASLAAAAEPAKAPYVLEFTFGDAATMLLKIPEDERKIYHAAELILKETKEYGSGLDWISGYGQAKGFGEDGTYFIIKHPFILQKRKDAWRVMKVWKEGLLRIRTTADGEIELAFKEPGRLERVEKAVGWRELRIGLTKPQLEAEEPRSYFPAKGLEWFIMKHLDLSTLPEGFGPIMRYPEAGGGPQFEVVSTAKTGQIEFKSGPWNLKLKILGRKDYNMDAIEDVEVCAETMGAPAGLRIKPLLLSRYGPKEDVKSVFYDKSDCP